MEILHFCFNYLIYNYTSKLFQNFNFVSLIFFVNQIILFVFNFPCEANGEQKRKLQFKKLVVSFFLSTDSYKYYFSQIYDHRNIKKVYNFYYVPR
jgi:hypothetical protein